MTYYYLILLRQGIVVLVADFNHEEVEYFEDAVLNAHRAQREGNPFCGEPFDTVQTYEKVTT